MIWRSLSLRFLRQLGMRLSEEEINRRIEALRSDRLVYSRVSSPLGKRELVSIGEKNFTYGWGKRPFVILPSSGFGGEFAFGLIALNEIKLGERFQDFLLDLFFDVKKKPTLILCALGMGIYVTSSVCSVANVGVRMDTAMEVLRRFSSDFEQIVVASDNTFLKNLVEQMVEEGFSFGEKFVFIVGEEPFPESYRSYISSLTGSNSIFSSYGMAEIGLNMCCETPYTVSLRKKFYDLSIDKLWDDTYPNFIPMVFQFPCKIYWLEEDKEHKLMVSTLAKNRSMCLIRYCIGDVGKVVFQEDLPLELQDKDGLGWPLALIWGRSNSLSLDSGEVVFVEQVKDVLYSIYGITQNITGAFKMKKGKENLIVMCQMKKGRRISSGLLDEFRFLMQDRYGIAATLEVVEFDNFPFWDYEHKLAYL